MLFNSFAYLVFLPLMVLLYWCTPMRFRPPMLLVGSYFFYASWNPLYLLLILGMTVANWLYGFAIARSQKLRKFWLIAAIVTDLAILGYFKYTNFFLNLGYDVLNTLH